MTDPRQHIEATLEAQRFTASQASREQAEQAAWRNALERAAELALAGKWADSKRVLEIAKGAN